MAEPLLLPREAHFAFRGGEAARVAAGAAFGVALPVEACRAARGNGRAALWQGPDEWLLVAPATEEAGIVTTIADALADVPHALVGVGHRNMALELAGSRAADMLNAGCPLDLSLAAFPVDACTRTVLAKAPVVLWRTGTEMFWLGAWRSFMPYVQDFLIEARARL